MKKKKDVFHKKGKYVSIREQIMTLFILLIVIPVTMISLISYSASRSIIQRRTSAYNTDILTEISNNIAQGMDEIDSMTVMVCYNDNVQKYLVKINDLDNYIERTQLGKLLVRELMNSTVANMAVSNPTLFTYAQNALSIDTTRITYTNLVFEQSDIEAMNEAKGRLVWIADKSNPPKILFGRVINDLNSQKPIGYFMANYSVERINALLKENSYFSEGGLHLLDGGNRIIASNCRNAIGSIFEYSEKLNGEKDGKYLKESGIYINQSSVANTDWKLVSAIPAVYYEKELILLRRHMLLISCVMSALVFVIAWVFAQKLTDSIRNLCKLMTIVGEGNFDIYHPVKQRNEIGMLYHFFFKMTERLQRLMIQNEQQQMMIQKAKLNSLRMQINPHFIYNTLESIKWTAHLNHNDDIVIMVKALGDFMRNSISDSEFVTLKMEMTNVQNYLTIQKYRYGDRLLVETDIPLEMEKLQIPKLILQPLIENAIVHGLEQKIGAGSITIRVWRERDDAYIIVKDNGIGISEEMLMELDLEPMIWEPAASACATCISASECIMARPMA